MNSFFEEKFKNNKRILLFKIQIQGINGKNNLAYNFNLNFLKLKRIEFYNFDYFKVFRSSIF